MLDYDLSIIIMVMIIWMIMIISIMMMVDSAGSGWCTSPNWVDHLDMGSSEENALVECMSADECQPQ